jgi:hypothetical protein
VLGCLVAAPSLVTETMAVLLLKLMMMAALAQVGSA